MSGKAKKQTHIISDIDSSQHTEELLKQSQRLTEELQHQQEELLQANEELEEKAREVSKQNEEMERKNAEVEKARSKLEEQAKQLSFISKYKSEFLANMSHELRTPLNSLLILSQQLASNSEQNLTEKQVEYARTIFASGRDLLSLINEVLDLAKIESGTMAIDLADVKLPALRTRLEQSFDAVAKDKNLEFKLTFGAKLPATIRSDEKRLMQVLRNLLSNAFKFTETGGVRLTVDVASKGWRPSIVSLNSAEKVISLTVADTGIGIEKKRLNVIFQAFQQADGSTSRRFGGTGLGLSISREIASMLGGDLVVESKPGEGSAFTLYLPTSFDQTFPVISSHPKIIENAELVPDASAAPMPVLAKANLPGPKQKIIRGLNLADTTLAGKKVLIVDDDARNIFATTSILERQDMNVVNAESGREGINLLRETADIDLVLMDIMMPEMDGYQAIRKIRKLKGFNSLPIIALTAKAMPEDRGKCIKAGASDYIVKPVDAPQLISLMRVWMYT